MKLTMLSLALIGTALMSHAPSATAVAFGDTKVCRVYFQGSDDCPESHTDVDTDIVPVMVPYRGYQSIQWIGNAFACTSSNDGDDGSKDGYCNATFAESSGRAVTWKLGFKISVAGNIPDIASVSSELNGEYGKSVIDTDTVTMATKIPVGYTDRLYSYVHRDEYLFVFSGYWDKDSAGYGCGIFRWYTCYKYTWVNDVAGHATAFVAEDGGQTFAFKRYTNGSKHGLVLEKDN